ncbi:MAG TPA: serine/threonine-protein kinase, partial [Kofleriaceae bacterium]|nr:serine/threonine-protein kinase [Kofleriaceae bacterium]
MSDAFDQGNGVAGGGDSDGAAGETGIFARGAEEFGPYLVYERLGQGGMATVHRAEKRGVGIRRPIALKRLLPHVAEDPDLVKLFVDEARLASHLHHANVAQTYELGKVDDTFFIAMEYASGPSLAQIVKQSQQAAGEIPLPITVNILTQVCEALDYAHNLCDESGKPLRIIHRDVSPANILVTNTGIVKLIDFGIAKATISSVKTQTGFIKGKFGYIAPEYITGRIDARVDLFAVGVVAHEMMTGRRLFEGADDFETLQNIRDMNLQPPSCWNPDVTPDLDDIVMI